MTLGSFLLGFLYYAAAYLCLRAFASKKKSEGSLLDGIRSFARVVLLRPTRLPELARAAAPWLGLASFFVLFGLSRQFNLQVALTEWMQSQAIIEGWYEDRSGEQLRFIAISIAMGVLLALAAGFVLRKRLAEVGVPLLATTLLIVLLLIRTASHHSVDVALRTRLLGLQLAHLLELAGLFAVAGSALAVAAARAGEPKAARAVSGKARIERD